MSTPGELMHYREQPGEAICTRDTELAWPGDWLTTTTAEVTCPGCLRWVHA